MRDEKKEKPEKVILLRQFKGQQWECQMKGVILPGDIRHAPRMIRVKYRQHKAKQRLDKVRGQENESV